MATNKAYLLFKENADKVYASSPFGYRTDPITGQANTFHDGVDYAPVVKGTKYPLYALADGIVHKCGTDSNGGKFVFVRHAQYGHMAVYYHLDSTALVKGQIVMKDAKIGIMGQTGRATGVHLHFGWCPLPTYSETWSKNQWEDFETAMLQEVEKVAELKKGTDISAHQKTDTVRQLVKGGIAQFIICRGSIGTSKVDTLFPTFIKHIQENNMPTSVYVASYAKDEAEAKGEADFICDLLEQYNVTPALPLYFDWEYFSSEWILKQFGIATTKQLVQDLTVAFCEQVKARGYQAGFYANKDFCTRFYTSDFFTAHPDYSFWYARPGLSAPDMQCDLWQFASNAGTDFGYSGNIDKNILYSAFIAPLPDTEVMQPLSKEPCRMRIGFASEGDIKKLITKITGLGIAAEAKDGYIITGLASAGDQCYIMQDCIALGVAYEMYVEEETSIKTQLVAAMLEQAQVQEKISALVNQL